VFSSIRVAQTEKDKIITVNIAQPFQKKQEMKIRKIEAEV
jgi:hypothetical protein